MIAIKNFEMPKDCDSCPFYTYDSRIKDNCCITREELYHVKIGERHEKCPLVVLKQDSEKTAHWIPYVKCSKCGICKGVQSDYCPNCGTKMQGEYIND